MIASSKTELKQWVEAMANHFQPAKIHWCTGTQEEYDSMCQQLVDKGTFIKLNPQKQLLGRF